MRALFSFRGELRRDRWLRQFFWAFAATVALPAVSSSLPLDDTTLAYLGRAALPYLLLQIALIGASVSAGWIIFASTAKRARYFGWSPWGCIMLSVPIFGWVLALVYYGQADETALRAQT